MTGEFDGKVALVTGGAGHVGRLIVERFARAGAHVVLNCFHSFAASKDIADALTADGLDVAVIRASVAKPAQVQRMFAEVGERYGRLDVLVNNAALGSLVNLPDVTEEMLDRCFATNVKGPLWCARAARPLMHAGGAIVNVSSIGAGFVLDHYLPIGVTKAALEGLTRYLAADFADDGIRVNTASSGPIDNPTATLFPNHERMLESIVAATPLGRLADSQDLAELVLILASERTRFMTGQVMFADGGLTLASSALSPGPDPAQHDPTPQKPAPPRETQRSSPVHAELRTDAPAPMAPVRESAPDAVAIVGMGIAVPGASSPEEFWTLLNDGAELFQEPPTHHWRAADFSSPDRSAPDKTYQPRGAFIADVPPGTRDDTEVWLRACLQQAMDGVTHSGGDRFSLLLGYTPDGSRRQEYATVRDSLIAAGMGQGAQQALGAETLPLGPSECYLPYRIAQDAIDGILPAQTRIHLIDTACSSSLYAIDLGFREILTGAVDVAVCGGAYALTPTLSVLFSKNGGLSSGGAVRALDADADGVLFADGAGLVVLKRLDRAVTDGDTIHGIITDSGLSADGRGAAIFAPAADGQARAIRRALQHIRAEDIDLIVAHGTGTSKGDAVELAALRECYRHPVSVVSNKSLIGHTTWAAGVVSVIHLLLALRHEMIPPQHRFRKSAEPLGNLTIPTSPVPWPTRRDGHPRMGAVSGFGFGGTNAHMVFQEYQPNECAPEFTPATTIDRGALAPDDNLVLVGWSTREPPTGENSFGRQYPAPPLAELRLTPATVSRLDRTQLMLVDCMNRMDSALREACQRRKDRVGVVVGHCGPTRHACLHRCRIHLDALDRITRRAGQEDKEFMARFREQALTAVADPSADSFPGEMPNILAGRLSNYFDLRGLNLTLDAGEASLIDAFEVAGRYLASGALDIALVGAAHGNTLPTWKTMHPDDSRNPRECAYLFAMTSRSFAEKEALPILATVAASKATEHTETMLLSTSRDCCAAAEGGAQVAAFLSTDTAELQISRVPSAGQHKHGLHLRRERTVRAAVQRYSLALIPDEPEVTARRQQPLFPEGCVVLTNYTRGWSDPSLPAHTSVVHVGDSLAEVEPDLAQVLSSSHPLHIRVVADLTGSQTSVLRLHDAIFLATQQCSAWIDKNASIVAYVLGGIGVDRTPHALSGLFTGFCKALLSELPNVQVKAVVHHATSLAAAASDLEAETQYDQPLAAVYYTGGTRLTMHAEPQPPAPAAVPLTTQSVVVAAGGARGIGAEILKMLAREVRPHIFVLGTTSLDAPDQPAEVDRATFIQAHTTGPERVSPASASAEFELLLNARQARATLAELAQHCGPARVTYQVCDLRQSAAVQHVIDEILSVTERVDLLLNIAGVSKTRALADKSLADFAAVRDTKVLAHTNLSTAFADRRPRLWCNFGSVAGFTTLPGETDYCAANDFLFSAALGTMAQGEFTIGWPWWNETGFASTPIARSYLDTDARLTPMTTKEGIHHFMNELCDPKRPRATIYIGHRERSALDRTAPGKVTQSNQSDSPCKTVPFYLDHIEHQTPDALTATRVFDLNRDGYLLDHQVNGTPTLPGAFFVEIAAEAAQQLAPGAIPTAFEDLRLESFLRIYAPDRPRPVHVKAHLETGDHHIPTVQVQISGDVIAPAGQILVRDRTFASVRVILGTATQPAPVWERWNDNDTQAAINPYYTDNPTLHLKGIFVSTAQPAQHPCGHTASLDLKSKELSYWLGDLATPIVTIDGMAQVAQLIGLQPPSTPRALLPVPNRARRIDLYGTFTDTTLAAAPDPITLYATPRHINPEGHPVTDAIVAVAHNGTVIARITELTWVVPAARSRQPDKPGQLATA